MMILLKGGERIGNNDRDLLSQDIRLEYRPSFGERIGNNDRIWDH
jgi:hypothetical protein